MPIDASIALQGRPPQIENPIEAYGRVLNLKHMLLQGQAGQQSLAEGALALKQAQRNEAFQQQYQDIAREHFANAGQPAAAPNAAPGEGPNQGSGEGPAQPPSPTSPGFPDKLGLIRKLQQAGNPIGDQLYAGYLKQQAEQATTDQARAHALTYNAQTTKATADTAKINSDLLEKRASGFLLQPPDQQAAQWPQFRAQQIKDGLMTPESTPEQFPGTQWVTQKHNELAGANAIHEAATKQAEEARKQAMSEPQLAEATTKAAVAARQDAAAQLGAAKSKDQYGQILNSLPHGIATQFTPAEQWDAKTTPDAVRLAGMNPDQQATTTQNKLHQTEEEKQGRTRLGYEGARLGIERARFNATLGAGKDANGQPLKGPDGKPVENPVAAAMAHYQVPPISPRAMATPQGQQLMKEVLDINPGYKGEQFQVTSRLRQAMISGKQGQNIGNLNTATVHLDQFLDAANELENGTFTPGNAVYNAVAKTFGGDAPTNFASLKTAVSGELANALKGNATDVEIHNIEKAIESKNSPKQLKGFIQTQLHVMGAKLNTYDEQYHEQVQDPNDKWSPVKPAATAVFQKNGINPVNRTAPKSTGGKIEKWGFDSSGKLVKQ